MINPELRKKLWGALDEFTELNKKADIVRAKFTPIDGTAQFVSDEDIKILKAADTKWNEVYELMKEGYPDKDYLQRQ